MKTAQSSKRFYSSLSYLCALCVLCVLCASASAQPKPVPTLQVIPQADDQAAFVRDDTEIARYHFGAALKRPFLFPIIGPSGRGLTRMGHPHDPVTHSHHNSVWVSHKDVNGVNFWEDSNKARILCLRVERYEDLGEISWVQSTNAWVDEEHHKTVMTERRRSTVQLLPHNEWVLYLDLQLEAPADEPVTFGKTPFGLVGVRMAKTIGQNDGGGEIRNSAGQSGEKDILWKAAKWVDYSGPIREGVLEGITLMDHPANPNHPTIFHVRPDGWMGTSLTQAAPRTIEAGKALRVRYALYVHAGKPSLEDLDKRWGEFAKTELPDLNPPVKKN